jgi:hypothetical protein
MPVLALKAAAAAVALGAAGTAGHSALASHSETAKVIYVVRSGDTLGGIAAYFCHNRSKYHELARANGISNPNVINVGQRIWLACGGTGGNVYSSARGINGSSYAQGSAVVPATSSVYSYVGLERLWRAAGGSRGTAYRAACIAEHESGGRSGAISSTSDYGLWQIHNGGYAMLNPYANAQRAVAMSGNGSNWSQWTTRGMC